MLQNFPAQYWHALDWQLIQCDLCPQTCKLREGQSGKCGVRRCHQNQLFTLYGKISGLAVDPIEKKPLYHFLPGSEILSFGTVGCNLSCKFCQNWDISSDFVHRSVKELAPEEIINLAKKHASGVAFTYNEPTIFIEYATAVAQLCRKEKINTVAVSNGYVCAKPRVDFFSCINAANIDLKAFSNKFYQKLTGSSLQPVLDTLCYLKQHTQVWLEITYLLIPEENDAAAEIEAAAKWIKDNLGPEVPLHFSAFHPTWKMQHKSATEFVAVKQAREIARNQGLYYVYTGNIYDPEGSNTYCYKCGKGLIVREGFRVIEQHLTPAGQCKFCNTLCHGVFSL